MQYNTNIMVSPVEKYISPAIISYEFRSEGVLCASNEGLGQEQGPPWDPSYLDSPLY